MLLSIQVSCAWAAEYIKLGSTGSEVSQLQTMLKDLGYYTGDITGHVGTKTETAIKAFQGKYGLTEDGIIGPDTLEKLEAIYSGESSSSSLSWISSDDIKDAQTMLKALGIYSGDITGNIGTKTKTAIRYFQKKYSLTVDGIPGTETLTKLRSVYLQSNASSTASVSISVATVQSVQTMLKALGFYSGDVTGNIGTKTEAAIKAFQSKYGLTADGIPGTKTLTKLNAVYSGDSTSTSSGSSLKYGSTGTDVSELQENLTTLGYYYADITGHYGTKTEAAVKSFQKAKGLTADGIAGSKTLDAIDAALGKSGSSSSAGTTVDLDDSYGRIIKDNVNLRSTYSMSSTIVTKLDEDEPVRISKKITASSYIWYYVTATVGSYTYKGYIRSDMMEVISQTEYESLNGSGGHSETLGKLKITASSVTLRSEPSSSADKMGTASYGSVYYYCAVDDGWYQLSTGYWVSGSYVSIVSSDDNTDSGIGLYDTGETVLWIQEVLKDLGYYYAECTGHYGTKTQAAVKVFQQASGLTADGIVGSKTLAALQEAADETGETNVSYSSAILDLHWFNEKSYYLNHGVKTGYTLTVTDVKSGKSFEVKVQSTGYHADVEPKTAEDTRILCSIFGVVDADDISYTRKAILVTASVSGVSYTYAASMYCEVHGAQTITDNDYDGQFCIHFRHSTTSETQIEYAVNQDPIDTAVTYATQKLGMTHVTDSSQL